MDTKITYVWNHDLYMIEGGVCISIKVSVEARCPHSSPLPSRYRKQNPNFSTLDLIRT